MDTLFTPNIPDEAEDIPQTDEPVWIFGKKYNAIKELDAIRRDIRSKLWFTYRKGFVPIGGCNSTFTSDKGWGCMLRCGQMVLAQALITLHLGKDWQWMPETKNNTYLKILRRFEDKRAAAFSIHQIALMGASEGKEVGQWFGPNTIAQVLKKLIVYDEWSSLTIHVALDNTLIINDILGQCRVEGGVTAEADGEIPLRAPSQWKPLLLLIPLRLGLSEINPVYINGLKTSFKISQSLGVIGGKPNLALYFIGCVGDDVIYLDPHTTQRSGSVEDKISEEEIEMDITYHCKSASRIPITSIDPSVALCFFCATEKEFKSLCKSMQEELILPEKQPLFELCTERLAHWSPADDAVSEAIAASSYNCRNCDYKIAESYKRYKQKTPPSYEFFLFMQQMIWLI
ncbi:PREDICTED: cysteine protease ATG4B isoform X1 [Wasmannia auropunctata]|uniref:cysteine protease ATG4B isoform X1 n=1 Tax=Wasmannia auropunctata TaxID=64793 RepID=UPI0005EDE541|nr:PREDICTED: cysteine protease ATG4B isoform X1 [Wasmannia auropunctata]XP_011696685.1 PREDICTED: cysteine protease ATG4B isoform X1 [Wasmannia auropunctata]XP_011696686.1 PREDICTED: cysteine protease ATG4B isoform X1 [Wasmannia auropunctata]XP_011696687.1 PREDICTED: cysteine protease ATG4B isoform X1 [Wasmannia auropunctata]